MNTRRAVSIALAVAAAAMLATSSLGFSSVSAERGVQVNVVDAEDAYVNATVCRVDNGSANKVRVQVTNQYSSQFTVDTITTDRGRELPAGQQSVELSVGESETFDGRLKANDEVTVHVSGNLTATVRVEIGSPHCPIKGTSGSEGSGNDHGSNGTKGNGSNSEGAP